MWDHLRQPGGRLGSFSLFAALVLGVVGIGGVVALCVSAALGLDFLWYKGSSVQLVSAVLFGFIADGAVGFWIMDRRPWLGVVLAVFGCVIFTLFLLWTVVAMALGPLFAVTAIQRAKVLSELDGSAPPDAASSAG